MPADNVKICNLALAKVGSPPITDMAEGSREARSCALIFETCRDEVLQLRPWDRCTRRVALAPLAEAPPFEYTAAYQLPPDYLGLVRLGDNDDAVVPHKIEEGRILTNAATANIIYIFRNEDSATYEPVLVDLIATRMAVDLALTVANNSALSVAKGQQYEAQRLRARSVDGMTSGITSYNVTSLVDARL